MCNQCDTVACAEACLWHLTAFAIVVVLCFLRSILLSLYNELHAKISFLDAFRFSDSARKISRV